MLNIMKKKDLDQILNMKLIKKIARGNTENLRQMIEPIALIAQFLTKESVKNETECCYTFDFPSAYSPNILSSLVSGVMAAMDCLYLSRLSKTTST